MKLDSTEPRKYVHHRKYVPHVRTGRDVSFVWLFLALSLSPFAAQPHSASSNRKQRHSTGVLCGSLGSVLFCTGTLDLLSRCSSSTMPQLAHWLGPQSQFDINGKQALSLSEDRRGCAHFCTPRVIFFLEKNMDSPAPSIVHQRRCLYSGC